MLRLAQLGSAHRVGPVSLVQRWLLESTIQAACCKDRTEFVASLVQEEQHLERVLSGEEVGRAKLR